MRPWYQSSSRTRSVAGGDFTVREPHGVLLRSGVQIDMSSESRGWSSLYASVQREPPYEAAFDAVDDDAIVLHLDSRVMAHRRTPLGENGGLRQAGDTVTIPATSDFRMRLGGTHRSLHLHVRCALI
jgi:AraC family transcriptional regulator